MGTKKKDKILVSFVDETASEDVTGSGVYIKTPNHSILIEFGLSQGYSKLEDFKINNRKYKQFKPKDIDLIFVSHLHADHSLLIPKLFRDGCEGAVILPNDSKNLFKIMALDSANITERDVLVINSQSGKNYKPLYSVEDVNKTLEHTFEKNIGEKIKIDDEISFKFVPSGHLLNSCQILLYITIDGLTKTICYTGDLGNHTIKNRFVGTFEPITSCDLLIGESTYGDRPELKTGIKERKNDLDKLKSIIDTQVHDMNGKVVIPSFAMSRSQQLALMIYELYKNDSWQPNVFIDSPLSINIFYEYQNILTGEEKEIFDELMSWDKLHFTKEPMESKALVESNQPCVIISSSGMCQVGRIRHHIKSIISNHNATLLFVGFSTDGTLASMLKDPKRKTINIDDKEYKCCCSSYSLKSLSGHATFKVLLSYYSNVNTPKIVLHHGSKEAKETLSEALKKELEKKCKTTRVVIANSSLKFSL